MSSREPGGARARQAPERTSERRLAGWQRTVRWVLWLTFLGLAAWKSQSVRFSGLEWLALAAAVGFSIWCMAKPRGGPKVELAKPAHLLGTFASRTSWAMLLIGALLTVGGVAGAGAACYDMVTGRATFGDVLYDIAIFVEGWIAEMIGGPTYDAELEKTHAYALFVLIVPGLIMLWLNLIPLLRRGSAFRVEPDGSVQVRQRGAWEPLLEHQYATVIADGATIDFTPQADGSPVTLPQARVYCRENDAHLKRALSAQFFAELLAARGFTVDGPNGGGFSARRT